MGPLLLLLGIVSIRYVIAQKSAVIIVVRIFHGSEPTVFTKRTIITANIASRDTTVSSVDVFTKYKRGRRCKLATFGTYLLTLQHV